MSVDLQKNRSSILKAFEDLLDDKSETDWMLLGYEGQTDVLKHVSSGDGGLEELADDLNSSKIMYAVVRVEDPKTTRTKLVLINWQGEGAPTLRKGTCARHLHDVKGLLKGVHVTVNARNEEEVEEEQVLAAVAKSTSTSYNFSDRSEHSERTKPVSCLVDEFKEGTIVPTLGTNYKRTNPLSEINSDSRNKFWEEQEKQEQFRKEQELKKQQEEKSKLELERKKSEAESASFRAAAEQERSARILADKRATEAAEERMRGGRHEEKIEDRENDEQERAKRAEQMRRERKKEAESLIGHSTKSTRSMFESMRQDQTSAPVSKPPARKLKQFTPLNQFNNQATNTKEVPKSASGQTGRIWPPPSNSTVSAPQEERKQPKQMFGEEKKEEPQREITSSNLGRRQDPIGGNCVPQATPSLPPPLPSSPPPYVSPPPPQRDSSSPPDPAVASRPLPPIPSGAPTPRPSPPSPENLYEDPQSGPTFNGPPQNMYEDPQSGPTFNGPPQNMYEGPDSTPMYDGPQDSGRLYEGPNSVDSQRASENLYEDDRLYEPVESHRSVPRPSASNPQPAPTYVEDNIYEDSEPIARSNGVHHRYDEPPAETFDAATAPTVKNSYQNQPGSPQAVSPGPASPHVESTPSVAMTYEVDGIEYQLLPEHGLCARALYDYQASDDTEISFDPSEIISNIEQIDEGWWQGVGPSGDFGLFPANYVELINAANPGH